jgi:hypothetical protein
MKDAASKCPKCDGEMKEGFIVDRGHMRSTTVTRWHPDAPKESFWYGLSVNPARERRIAAYCCDKCGFVECYARPIEP